MDVDVVARLRRVLAPTGWAQQAAALADRLADETVVARGLVVVAAGGHDVAPLVPHLGEVASRREDDRLHPRRATPGDLTPVAGARAGESVLVVATGPVDGPLARALATAAAADACVTSIDVGGCGVLDDVAHTRLTVRRPGAATWLPDRLPGRAAEPDPPRQQHARGLPVDAFPLDLAEHLLACLLLHRGDSPGVVRRLLATFRA